MRRRRFMFPRIFVDQNLPKITTNHNNSRALKVGALLRIEDLQQDIAARNQTISTQKNMIDGLRFVCVRVCVCVCVGLRFVCVRVCVLCL